MRNRIMTYLVNAQDLQAAYPQGHRINADQDPQTVFECIESELVHPTVEEPGAHKCVPYLLWEKAIKNNVMGA